MTKDTSGELKAVNDDTDPADSNLLPELTLILGGARSGKSHHAETLIAGHLEARTSIVRPTYIATAEAGDGEMVNRIADHRTRRGDRWHTEETLLALADTIVTATSGGQPALVDCLTLWLSNVMHAELDIEAETSTLLDAFEHAKGPVVCVSNEVGLGIVPDNALARAFRDAAGRLNQQVAARADRVDFVAAGLPITLKNETP
ncbi:MAG: bifunctional adenosylcobinamide kinase/adenosylcobinamide-phosphate guanylyltransferase [Proteobacteria bacterium]|nr:bifunctional adenosylcobinamide kinase/adenosylcobinamide-phosphate guanylyltransferase [Pseudomonadota bacterium]